MESAVDNPPDVVLLDLGLPDIEGLQVLAMLGAVSEVPVIIITARDDDADMVKALDGGAGDYVVKPFGSNSSKPGCVQFFAAAAPSSPKARWSWAGS